MTIEQLIEMSTCYGVAYDATVQECKECGVKTRCESKCRENTYVLGGKPLPTVIAEVDEVSYEEKVPKKTAKRQTAKSAATSKKTYSADMPEFKQMSVPELEELVVRRNAGILKDFDKYGDKNIRRMRLIMALKKTYEV